MNTKTELNLKTVLLFPIQLSINTNNNYKNKHAGVIPDLQGMNKILICNDVNNNNARKSSVCINMNLHN